MCGSKSIPTFVPKSQPSNRFISYITSILAGLLLISCGHPSSTPSQSGQKSVEQRLADLEKQGNSQATQLSEAEARKQYEHDLAEIQKMGLVERAHKDFSNRLTNAIIEKWTIGYFMHTNTVWCDVQYRLPNSSEILQQEFGYTWKAGTNWSLIWGVGGQPQ
jgi:hypothetical protein